jgi:aminopeptidase-like protein
MTRPQLGKRGLYGAIGGQTDRRIGELAMLWVLNLADGRHTLLDIAEQAGIEFEAVRLAAQALLRHELY